MNQFNFDNHTRYHILHFDTNLMNLAFTPGRSGVRKRALLHLAKFTTDFDEIFCGHAGLAKLILMLSYSTGVHRNIFQ